MLSMVLYKGTALPIFETTKATKNMALKLQHCKNILGKSEHLYGTYFMHIYKTLIFQSNRSNDECALVQVVEENLET